MQQSDSMTLNNGAPSEVAGSADAKELSTTTGAGSDGVPEDVRIPEEVRQIRRFMIAKAREEGVAYQEEMPACLEGKTQHRRLLLLGGAAGAITAVAVTAVSLGYLEPPIIEITDWQQATNFPVAQAVSDGNGPNGMRMYLAPVIELDWSR